MHLVWREGGQVGCGSRFASPACLEALNGRRLLWESSWRPALYVGLWESPRASLSQPLKSRDYL